MASIQPTDEDSDKPEDDKDGDKAEVHLIVPEDNKFLIDPRHRVTRLWSAWVNILLLVTAFWTPYDVAFLEPSINGAFIVNRCIDLFFFTDTVRLFFTMHYMDSLQIWVTNYRRIASLYLRGWFWIDIVSVIPFDVVAMAMDSGSSGDAVSSMRAIRVIRLLRLMRLLRMAHAKEAVNKLQDSLELSGFQMTLCKCFVALITVTHWMACIFRMVPDFELVVVDQQPYNWMSQAEHSGNTDASTSSGEALLTAWFWAAMTITSVGFTDITTTNGEKATAVFCMLFGCILFWVCLGAVTDSFTNLDSASKMYTAHKDVLNTLAAEMQLPSHLIRRLRAYLRHSRRLFKSKYRLEWVNQIAPSLKKEISSYIHGAAVKQVPFFRSKNETVHMDFVSRLCAVLEPILFEPKEAVVHHGDRMTGMFLITSGVCLDFGNKKRYFNHASSGSTYFSFCFSGDVMCVEGLLFERRFSYSVKALTFLQALTIKKKCVDQILHLSDFSDVKRNMRFEMIRQAIFMSITRAAEVMDMKRDFREGDQEFPELSPAEIEYVRNGEIAHSNDEVVSDVVARIKMTKLFADTAAHNRKKRFNQRFVVVSCPENGENGEPVQKAVDAFCQKHQDVYPAFNFLAGTAKHFVDADQFAAIDRMVNAFHEAGDQGANDQSDRSQPVSNKHAGSSDLPTSHFEAPSAGVLEPSESQALWKKYRRKSSSTALIPAQGEVSKKVKDLTQYKTSLNTSSKGVLIRHLTKSMIKAESAVPEHGGLTTGELVKVRRDYRDSYRMSMGKTYTVVSLEENGQVRVTEGIACGGKTSVEPGGLPPIPASPPSSPGVSAATGSRTATRSRWRKMSSKLIAENINQKLQLLPSSFLASPHHLKSLAPHKQFRRKLPKPHLTDAQVQQVVQRLTKTKWFTSYRKMLRLIIRLVALAGEEVVLVCIEGGPLSRAETAEMPSLIDETMTELMDLFGLQPKITIEKFKTEREFRTFYENQQLQQEADVPVSRVRRSLKVDGETVPALSPGMESHFFLSHCQGSGGDQTYQLFLEFQRLGFHSWYDNRATNLTLGGMEQGIETSCAFVLFLSEGALSRDFVQHELRHALKLEKPVILIHETDSRHGAFDFETRADLPDDIKSVLVDIESIPFRRRAWEREAMLRVVINRCAFGDVETEWKKTEPPPAATPVLKSTSQGQNIELAQLGALSKGNKAKTVYFDAKKLQKEGKEEAGAAQRLTLQGLAQDVNAMKGQLAQLQESMQQILAALDR
jgi:hypothetical protein